MKGIIHIRIDDRLIHGQVALFWVNVLKVNRIMVINDEAAVDDLQKSLLRIAAPANVNTSILSKDKALENIKADNYDGQRVLIVVKSPVDILYLVEHGLEIQSLNIGNMSGRDNTTRIRQNISVTADEMAALQQLLAKNIEITAVMTPNDAKVYLTDLLADHRRM